MPFQLFESAAASVPMRRAERRLIGDGRTRPAAVRSTAARRLKYQLAEGQDALVVDLNYSADGVNYIKRFTWSAATMR